MAWVGSARPSSRRTETTQFSKPQAPSGAQAEVNGGRGRSEVCFQQRREGREPFHAHGLWAGATPFSWQGSSPGQARRLQGDQPDRQSGKREECQRMVQSDSGANPAQSWETSNLTCSPNLTSPDKLMTLKPALTAHLGLNPALPCSRTLHQS